MLARRPLLHIYLVVLITLPGIFIALGQVHLSDPMMALITGAAIMAASFLLVWACDAAQSDVSQALALAAVALIAVLPEYAVDMYFTWQAGKFPDSEYAHYAIANMTGANRMIVGLAWVLIAVIYWFKTRRSVVLEEQRRLEVRFLALATLYAFIIPIKGSLAWYDGVVLIGIYIWYMILAGQRPPEHCVCDGPGAYIASLAKKKRRIVTVLMFLFAAGAIVANAERFCEGLIGTGKFFGINEFYLVQWLAPIASEAPEFVVAIMFALRGKAGMALGSLLSAKLNQWTLLVGMIPGVFAVSAGTLAFPIPMGHFQMQEILMTAAQSLLAVIMLAALRLTVGQAFLLFILFTSQLVAPGMIEKYWGGEFMGMHGEQIHSLFSILYLMSALVMAIDQPLRLRGLWPWSNAGQDNCVEKSCIVCGTPVDNLLTDSENDNSNSVDKSENLKKTDK